jgi:hypothetical protein
VLSSAVIVLGLLLLAVPGSGEESGSVYRVGLFIGANDGGTERIRLRWAESDARKLAQVMYEIGGIPSDNGIVLADPTTAQLDAQFDAVRKRIARREGKVRRSEFMLYYSGHSDEQGLRLGSDLYSYRRLRAAISEVEADVSIAILDSCASGAFTRLKGGTRTQPFLMDDSSDMTGHAFLTSSSADEAAQESDAIRASFFTHYLVSGLRGAADHSADGRITLNEVYQYAHAETLSRTESSYAGPQHPSYDIQLNGTGDLVLTDLQTTSSRLGVERPIDGRLFVRTVGGDLVAEVRKRGGAVLSLALPAGSYRLTLNTEDGTYAADVLLYRNRETAVRFADFEVQVGERNRLRGDADADTGSAGEDDGPRRMIPGAPPATITPDMIDRNGSTEVPAEPLAFNAHLLPGISLVPTHDRRYETSVSLGAIIAEDYRITGLQYSWIMNLVEDRVTGFQHAGVGNILEGDLVGFQHGGVFNIVEGDSLAFQGAGVFNIVQGSGAFLQGAGVFNIVGGTMSGVQASGVFNAAEELRGAQVSTVNVAGDASGAQLGVVNVADTARGVQLGLVNISNEMYGLPIGLVTIVKNGIHDLGYWHDRSDRSWLSFQNGTRWLYSIAYAGVSEDQAVEEFADLTFGLGLGVRLTNGFFFADMDLSAKHAGTGDTPEKRLASAFAFDGGTFPSLRLAGGFAFGRGLGFYVGTTLDAHIPGFTERSPLYHTGEPEYDFRQAGINLLVYPKLFFGVKL